jgi:hypothetical protein
MEIKSYRIPAANVARLQAAIADIAKKAAKVAARGALADATPITLTVGPVIRTETPGRRPGDAPIVTLHHECTVTGGAPRLAGWAFAATLQHEGAGTILRSVPGVEIDLARFRDAGPVCEHCNLDRRRGDTFVVVHDDGTVRQVGRTCLGEFLGTESPEAVARMAELLAAAGEACEGAEESGGYAGAEEIADLADYLAHVACMIRLGGWVSRTAARDRGDAMATADAAWNNRFPHTPAERAAVVTPTEQDATLAAAALAWGAGLDERTDLSDYEHNLRVALASGVVRHRLAGIVASVVPAYQRAMGQERERASRPVSTHVGTVGKRETWFATLERIFSFDTDYGALHVHKFRTAEGAILVWKTGSVLLGDAAIGQEHTVTGSVKKHDEYKGEAQTILTRCSVELGRVAPVAKVKAKRPTAAERRAKERAARLDCLGANLRYLGGHPYVHAGAQKNGGRALGAPTE